MKRVFHYKKGDYMEGDEPYIYFIEEFTTKVNERNFPIVKDNYKLTIIIEKID